jgi:hypothetical protein
LKGASLKGKLILILLVIAAIIPPTAAYFLIPIPPSVETPTVGIEKLYNTSLQPGQTIIVNITVSDVPSTIAYLVNVAFDPSVLKVTTGDPHGYNLFGKLYGIYEGSFLRRSTNDTMFLVNGVNNKVGNISAIYDGINPSGISSSGSGVIARINFTCVNATTNTAINMTGENLLLDTPTSEIQHQIVNGFVTAEAAPPPPAAPGIWTQLWFQVTLGVIICEVVIVVIGVFVARRLWRSRVEAESKESAEFEDLFK